MHLRVHTNFKCLTSRLPETGGEWDLEGLVRRPSSALEQWLQMRVAEKMLRSLFEGHDLHMGTGVSTAEPSGASRTLKE